MSELMIPQSMHESAVEAARSFGRQEAKREALALVARIVAASGGIVIVPDRAMVEDPLELRREDDPIAGTTTYRVR